MTFDPITYGGSTNPSFKYILDPAIIVWDNITYADIFYQDKDGNPFPSPTASQITQDKFPQNPQELEQQYDWQKDLSSLAGFDGSAAHERALDWYTGTANLTEGTEGRYRRLGDLLVDKIGQDSGQNWYSQDILDSGNKNAVWEGIGTGWFSSVLGGGYEYRPYSIDNALRSSVSLDNTAEARMRGDYAIPTLFDGNFDAIAFNAGEQQSIAGWSLYNGANDALQKNLVKWEEIGSLAQYRADIGYNPAQTNYALKLGDGLNEITHNSFVVPDWGALRFDLHVPVPESTTDSQGKILPQSSVVRVFLDGQELQSSAFQGTQKGYPGVTGNEYPAVDLREFELRKEKDAIETLGQENRIGFAKQGFQTFQVDIPNEFRGKVATLEFGVSGGKTVYLDNVFFKSQHLLFGDPILNGQSARKDVDTPQFNENYSDFIKKDPDSQFSENYLLEKPQYSLSYNSKLKTPNWVSYQLNKTLLGTETNSVVTFQNDLRSPFAIQVKDKDIVQDSNYQKGHLSAAADRSRNEQDNKTTFLTSNIIPMPTLASMRSAPRSLIPCKLIPLRLLSPT